MKRLASVVLSSALLVGTVLPASALAESPATAAAGKDKVQVQVINVRPEDIGPATYHEVTYAKPDKKTTVRHNGIFTTIVTSVITAAKKKDPGWWVAENQIDRRSWLNIWCYSLWVTGDYHTDGNIIDEYGDTDWGADAAITWTYDDGKSSWSIKSKTTGKDRASATFTQSIPLPILNKVQLRKVSDYVIASATP